MIRVAVLIVTFVVALIAGWGLANWAIPYVIMGKATEKLAKRAKGWNIMAHALPATPETQVIVRSSPDLLYSSCVYDLSSAPLLINVGQAGGYVSVSFFDRLTNNYETLTEEQVTPEKTTIVLMREGQVADVGGTIVISPSEKGLILVRRQFSKITLPEMRKAQLQDSCSLMK